MAYDWFLEQARIGNLYRACNQSAATVTLINTSTTTGFILCNPYGSGKKIVLRDANFTFTTVPTATSIVFLAQSIAPTPIDVTHTTPLVVYDCAGAGAGTQSIAKADSSSTTPNLPVYSRILGYTPTTPATTGGITVTDYINGAMILMPGTYVQISYITTAPVGITSMTWAEVAA